MDVGERIAAAAHLHHTLDVDRGRLEGQLKRVLHHDGLAIEDAGGELEALDHAQRGVGERDLSIQRDGVEDVTGLIDQDAQLDHLGLGRLARGPGQRDRFRQHRRDQHRRIGDLLGSLDGIFTQGFFDVVLVLVFFDGLLCGLFFSGFFVRLLRALALLRVLSPDLPPRNFGWFIGLLSQGPQ